MPSGDRSPPPYVREMSPLPQKNRQGSWGVPTSSLLPVIRDLPNHISDGSSSLSKPQFKIRYFPGPLDLHCQRLSFHVKLEMNKFAVFLFINLSFAMGVSAETLRMIRKCVPCSSSWGPRLLSPPLSNEQAETQSVFFTRVTQIGHCYAWVSDPCFLYLHGSGDLEALGCPVLSRDRHYWNN